MGNNNLKENIKQIIKELDRYKYLNRDQLFTYCINEKLKTTLANYEKTLDLSSETLLRNKVSHVLKEITKQQCKQEKNSIEEGEKH